MDIVLRAVILFIFVWFVTRAVGRRELSTLEPFDLILLVVLGDLIQQGVTQNDFSVTGAMLAGGTMAGDDRALLVRRVARGSSGRADPGGRSRRARRAREDDRPELAPQPHHARGARGTGEG